MGHIIGYNDFKDTATKSDMVAYAIERCEEEHGDGYDPSQLTLHPDIICDDWDSAVEKIEAMDSGWYDDHAVLYIEKSRGKEERRWCVKHEFHC